jgi:hypothetical protein
VLGAFLTACSIVELRERVVGTIVLDGDPTQLELPTEVVQGQPFTVEIVTYGGGCRKQGEIEVKGLPAEVTPYNCQVTLPDGVECTLKIVSHTHTATLSFEETGTAEVVFHDQQETRDGTLVVASVVTVTRKLEVC